MKFIAVACVFAAIFLMTGCNDGKGLLWEISKGERKSYIYATYHGGAAAYMKLPSRIIPIIDGVDAVGFEAVSSTNYVPEKRSQPEHPKVMEKLNDLKAKDLLNDIEIEGIVRTSTDQLVNSLSAMLVGSMVPRKELDSFAYSDGPDARVFNITLSKSKKIISVEEPAAGFKTWRESCGDQYRLEIIDSFLQHLRDKNYLNQATDRQQLAYVGNYELFAEKNALHIANHAYSKFEFMCSINPRNINWLPKIKAHYDAHSFLLVMGAGHVVGNGSILELLKKDGFEVKKL